MRSEMMWSIYEIIHIWSSFFQLLKLEIYCDDHSPLSSNNRSSNMNYFRYTSYHCEKVCDSCEKCLHRRCGEQRPTVTGLHGQYRGIFKPFHLDLQTNQLWFYMIHIHVCLLEHLPVSGWPSVELFCWTLTEFPYVCLWLAFIYWVERTALYWITFCPFPTNCKS